MVILITGCAEEDNPLADLGETTAILNDYEWEAFGGATLSEDGTMVSMQFRSFSSRISIEHILQFHNIPTDLGRYDLVAPTFPDTSSLPSARYYLYDVDVILDSYALTPSTVDSWLEVDYYDAQARSIEGRYELRFVVDHSSGESSIGNPSELFFESGTFSATVD